MELLLLYCVLSEEEVSRLKTGVLDRIGVAGWTGRGRRELEVRE
jgi:hypothetical protein